MSLVHREAVNLCVNLHVGTQLINNSKQTKLSEQSLCLGLGLIPRELYWAFAFISQLFLPSVPHLCSTPEAEEWLLKKLGWEQPLRTTQPRRAGGSI